MSRKIKNEHAVSPVVGVMLMLVVTIIIAAVVSAYAGGITAGQKPVPHVNLKASYSQSDGMRIDNNGGDVLNTQDINLVIRNTNNMGSGMEEWSQVINHTIIQNTPSDPTKFWVNATYGGIEVSRWAPGESMYITAANCQPAILQPTIHNYTASGHSPIGYADWATISAPGQVGSTFYLEAYTISGKQLTQIEVPITA